MSNLGQPGQPVKIGEHVVDAETFQRFLADVANEAGLDAEDMAGVAADPEACLEDYEAWLARSQSVEPIVSAADPMPMTEAEAKFLADDEAAIQRIAIILADAIDPKDGLKRNAKIGKVALAHAQWQKGGFPAWSAKDYADLCKKVEARVRLRVAVADVRVDTYIRVHVWVEEAKKINPAADQLSFKTVERHFLSTLEFSRVDLEGQIKPEWAEFVKAKIATQLGPDRMTVPDLKEAFAAQSLAIASDKAAKVDPGKAAAKALKEANEKLEKEITSARKKVSDSVSAALGGILDPSTVMGLVERAAADHKVKMPVNVHALADMTPADADLFVKMLFDAGNHAAIRRLYSATKRVVKDMTAASRGDVVDVEFSTPSTELALAS